MKQPWHSTSFVWATMLLSVLEAQFVQWGIEKYRPRHRLLGRSTKSTFEEAITNEKGTGGYFATVKIGYPGQDIVMQLDTASSDAWVPYSGAPICEGVSASCDKGSYDPADSKTFKRIAKDKFEITYADQSYSKGDYFQDTFEIGGAVLQNLTLGIGMQTNIPHGLVGVGYTTNEASLKTVGKSYANIPVVMQREGLINSVAYSLWLNDLDANKGNILFGGVDTEKYVGPLKKIDIIPDGDNNEYTHFMIPLTGLEATSPSGTDILTSPDGPVEVVLDSGTTLTYLPNDMTEKIWQEVGAKYQDAFGLAVLPCSHSLHPGHFAFELGGTDGPQINVTMDELVVDLTNGQQPRFTSGPYDGELVCEFGIQNYSSGPYVLGDTFLRSAYVVYDLENHEIGMAATDFNSTRTNIVAFESQGAAIPFARNSSGKTREGDSVMPTTTSLVASKGFQDGDDLDASESAAQAIAQPNGILALLLLVASTSW